MENSARVLNLHTQACEIASRYQKIEIELVDILQRIDQHRVYLKYGCGSLFDYAVSQLKLSESAAYNFIAVARKALEVPALKEAIKSQSLSVSKARRITSVITKENQETWIPKALELSQRDNDARASKIELKLTLILEEMRIPKNLCPRRRVDLQWGESIGAADVYFWRNWRFTS